MCGGDHCPLLEIKETDGLIHTQGCLQLCVPSLPKEWRDYDDLSMHSYPIASFRASSLYVNESRFRRSGWLKNIPERDKRSHIHAVIAGGISKCHARLCMGIRNSPRGGVICSWLANTMRVVRLNSIRE
jgi:hypothetical protein